MPRSCEQDKHFINSSAASASVEISLEFDTFVSDGGPFLQGLRKGRDLLHGTSGHAEWAQNLVDGEQGNLLVIVSALVVTRGFGRVRVIGAARFVYFRRLRVRVLAVSFVFITVDLRRLGIRVLSVSFLFVAVDLGRFGIRVLSVSFLFVTVDLGRLGFVTVDLRRLGIRIATILSADFTFVYF